MHGGSGIPDEAVQEAVKLGIRKINFSTVVKAEYIKGFTEFCQANPKEFNIRFVANAAMAKAKECVAGCLTLLGAAGKA